MEWKWSKQLGHDDQSGFEFSKELLGGDCTAAINFDRLQNHPQLGYIIIEYLLCEEKQTVTPYTSHPNKYWNKNPSKFLSLWRVKLHLKATLYLVNYAKKGTKSEDEVLLIEVLDMDETGIKAEKLTKFTRAGFAEWFREMNRQCLTEKRNILEDIYSHKRMEDIGKIILQGGKYQGEAIASVYAKDKGYLEWMKGTNYPFSDAVRIYLDKAAMELGNMIGGL